MIVSTVVYTILYSTVDNITEQVPRSPLHAFEAGRCRLAYPQSHILVDDFADYRDKNYPNVSHHHIAKFFAPNAADDRLSKLFLP